MKFKTENLKITWERKIGEIDKRFKRSLNTIIGEAVIIGYTGNNTFNLNDGRDIKITPNTWEEKT